MFIALNLGIETGIDIYPCFPAPPSESENLPTHPQKGDNVLWVWQAENKSKQKSEVERLKRMF